MIFLRTQANHSFDRRFVFTALHRRFNCFIFSIHIWIVSSILFLFAQYQAITHSAPKGDLLAPPVQRQRRAHLHLTYSIGQQTYLINQWFVFLSGHTSSRQREFHPKPLTEPYVIVSHHTALRLMLERLVLPMQYCTVDKLLKIHHPLAPSLHFHYKSINATMS